MLGGGPVAWRWLCGLRGVKGGFLGVRELVVCEEVADLVGSGVDGGGHGHGGRFGRAIMPAS